MGLQSDLRGFDPVAVVLGTVQVNAGEFTPAQRFAIWQGVVEKCKPLLPHLSGFHKLAEDLNRPINQCERLVTADSFQQFPPGLSATTLCRGLVCGGSSGRQTISYLTQEGRVFVWIRTEERVSLSPSQVLQGAHVVELRTTSSVFSWLDEVALRDYVHDFRHLEMMISDLCLWLAQTLEERPRKPDELTSAEKTNLDEMRRVRRWLGDVKSRLL